MNKATLVVTCLAMGVLLCLPLVFAWVECHPSAQSPCWDAPFEALDADDLQWTGISEGTPMVCARWSSLGEDRKLGTPRNFLARCWPAKPMSEKGCRQVPPVRKTP